MHKNIFELFIQSKSLPPMKNGSPLLMESAVELAAKIRHQEPGYSSVAVVKAVIERINQVNATLNAVVDTRCEYQLLWIFQSTRLH